MQDVYEKTVNDNDVAFFCQLCIYGASGSASDSDKQLLKAHGASSSASDVTEDIASLNEQMNCALKSMSMRATAKDSSDDYERVKLPPRIGMIDGHAVEFPACIIRRKASRMTNLELAQEFNQALISKKDLELERRRLEQRWERQSEDEERLSVEMSSRNDGRTAEDWMQRVGEPLLAARAGSVRFIEQRIAERLAARRGDPAREPSQLVSDEDEVAKGVTIVWQ